MVCNPARPDDQVVKEAVRVLESGAAIVMPTETQYSLSLRADRAESMVAIGRIKKRDAFLKPALFVSDIDMAKGFCQVSQLAERLAKRFLPGPLTMVLPERENQSQVSVDFLSEDGFGIRISSSPMVAAIMKQVSFAVTATSANISGQPAAMSISEMAEMLGDEIALYIDGGSCRGITPSTVIKVDEEVEILRHGLIGEAEIRQFLKLAPAVPGEEKRHE